MPSTELSLTVSPLLTESHPRDSAFLDFARATAYSAVQSPLTALAQPLDKVFGTDLAKATSFIDAPAEAEFGSGHFWAQQGGYAVGMLGTFWVAGKAVKGMMRNGLTEQQLATRLSERGLMGLTLKEAALTGFVHDSLLRPTDSKDTRSFVASRLGNGFTGAVTMATLTGAGMGLKGAGLKNDVLCGVLSGIPAGFVHAETDSLLRTGKLASGQDLTKSVSTMAVIGGGFGAWHQYRGQYESGRTNFNWGETKGPGELGREFNVVGGERALSEALRTVASGEGAVVKVHEHMGPAAGVRGWLGFQQYGPERSLLLQHGPKVDGRLAGKVDLIASCNVEPGLAGKSVVLDGKPVFLRAGQSRISLDSLPQRIRVGEREPLALGKTSRISEALTELETRFQNDKAFREANSDLEYHNLSDYAKALEGAGHKPVEFLGAGFESVAFLLESGHVLKITRTAELRGGWNDSWGTRSFDAKIKGEVQVLETPSGEIVVYKQPQVELGGIDPASPEYKAFLRKVKSSGEEFSDGDFAGDQVGYLLDVNGELVYKQTRVSRSGRTELRPVVVLIDYPSVGPQGERAWTDMGRNPFGD
jgi:hypothetical protein